ncbi:isoprenylcysteine carboxylmethyltransferase family protein [Pajaroellobacter abortibovis]|uniref:isoprenylcysteine carboxylmethyltransferase family protein n=1 Tax=Pajaroellobacter abortibovis TaxID=1882918 RepID=UPI00155F725C|nr:isoprenylcysteine carboxylmethyltransferase family protein [Pajaroellobacter abortibovis]
MDNGPYRALRRPSYLAMLLALEAVCLLLNSTFCTLLSILLVLLSYLCRVQREQRVFEAELGSKYGAYRQQTWKLLPFLF